MPRSSFCAPVAVASRPSWLLAALALAVLPGGCAATPGKQVAERQLVQVSGKRRCDDLVAMAQLGKDLTDADKRSLRADCPAK